MKAPDSLIHLGSTPQERCPYLGDRDASLHFFQPLLLAPGDLDELLARGLRRHGPLFYLPACPGGCRECVPIRVPVRRFRPSRSQRRLQRRHGGSYEVRVTGPAFRGEHLELFNRHAARVSPSARPLEPEEYVDFLLRSATRSVQIEYSIDGRVAGVGILDVGRKAASSIYFFWDPDRARFSPGTFSALWEIEWCRRNGQEYYYLGYRVESCPAMSYKSRFRPHEIMEWETGAWREGETTASLPRRA